MTKYLACLLVFALMLLAAAQATSDVTNGDLALPKKPKHGKPVVPTGFTVEGKRTRVTRFSAAPPYGQAIAIAKGVILRTEVVVPGPTKPDKLDPAGWYGVASVDIVGLTSSGRATLELAVSTGSRRRSLGSAKGTVLHVAQKDGGTTTPAAARTQRLWLKIPSKDLHGLADETLELALSVTGTDRVVVDDLRFDLFHDEPTRVLVGKPNGKNGPDLLASGALGFLALTEHMATAFSLLDIREGGRADKAGLERSDLVVAVDGVPLAPSSLAAGDAWFASSHEATLGRAIEHALDEGRKSVRLTVLRDRGPRDLELRLPFDVGFAETFPIGDDQARRMQTDMLAWITGHQLKNGFWPGSKTVNSCLAGLALLGTRDAEHKTALRRLVKALLELNPTAAETTGFSFWGIAYQGIFFCEYYLATGDKRVLAWIEDAIEWLPSTTHECKWGMQAFGHSPKGLPYDSKALMAPCAHLLVFEALAEECDVRSGVWRHIEPYVMHSWSDPKTGGHGAMGYNAAAKDKSQFWSRSGLVALALHVRGHHRRMQKALTAIMVERHPFMLNSHAYGEPGGALGLIGLAAVDPQGFAEVMQKWRWRFLNSWEPGFGLRYSSPHMGSPYMKEEEIVNPAYATLFTLLDKGLVITGAKPERWLAGRK